MAVTPEPTQNKPDSPKSRRRPGRRGKRGGAAQRQRAAEADQDTTAAAPEAPPPAPAAAAPSAPPAAAEPPQPKSQRSRRGGRGRRSKAAGHKPQPQPPAPAPSRPEASEPSTPPPPPAAAAKPANVSGGSRARTGRMNKVSDASRSGSVMVVNVSRGEECRIAIVHDMQLEEIYVERHSSSSHVGNIYKAVVTNVEPSIQAAFVDFGIGKNGFLHISDVQPQYFPGGQKNLETVGRKIALRDRPPIQRCLRRGDEVIVQVTKEGIGTKGPTLSTYLSIPGRYLVMMPGMSKLGVSRKIEDTDDRQDLRDVLQQLDLPADIGFILRTAGRDRTKREFQSDLNYLTRLWKIVTQRVRSEPAPAALYQESDLVVRTIRDVLTSDFAGVVFDDEETAARAREFLRIIMPRHTSMIQLYVGRRPLFHLYGIEAAIERIYSKHVPLPSGGSLVIESTEALVAIDVNSGKYREQDNPEATAYKTNMEAAPEIARQLRLRDLGGLIICDFIDMKDEPHKRTVEKALRDALTKHKERVQILRMSQFGIVEMTRQRQRRSIKSSLFEDCPKCSGTGLVKTPRTLMLDAMRAIQSAIHQEHVQRLVVTVPGGVGFELLNRKRAELTQLEQDLGVRIEILRGPDQDEVPTLEASDERGRPVKLTAGTH